MKIYEADTVHWSEAPQRLYGLVPTMGAVTIEPCSESVERSAEYDAFVRKENGRGENWMYFMALWNWISVHSRLRQ